MESDPKNSMISPTRKKQKMISDKQDDQSISHSSLEESSDASNQAPANSIKIFAVQSADDECLKWRVVPEKRKYEHIREQIRDDSFYCENAREWNPDVSCDDPSNVSQQDESMIWAIDRPDIPVSGWERLIKIRPEGSTQFADVFYKPPTGRMLRSTKDVENYLAKHPDVVAQGVDISKFSFEMPTPLQKDYVIKRSQKSQSDVSHTGATSLLQREEAQPTDGPAHDDPEDNNEDQPEVAQSDELPEEPTTRADIPPPAPAV